MFRLMSFCLVVGLMLVVGCGPSEVESLIEKTRKQAKAADVKAAVFPLFSHKDVESISATNLPKEITSLPLFDNAGAPPHIQCSRSSTNTLMFTTGSGFGHWGLILHHTGVDTKATESLRAKIIPWGEGVFFWIEL